MKDEKKKEEKVEKTVKEPESKAPEVNKEVETLKEQVVEAENKYRRALADYQNLQKRVQEEKIDWIKAANKELLLRLLPVLDTLMLANQHVQDEGLKVTIQQFLDTLKAEGVTQIKAAGQAFDPHQMECITTEEGEEDKVIKIIRAGYLMNEKVLRPAQVIVGRK